MNLGDRVKAARRHAKLTQVQLAEAIGMRQQTLSALERGDNDGSAKLAEIAVECGVSPRWLARGEGTMLDDVQTAPTSGVLESVADYQASQSTRPDPATIVITTRALLAFLRRRNPTVTLDLTQAVDAELFAEVYEMASEVDDEFELSAAVADLMAAREAKRGIEGESNASADGKEARRAASGK